MRYHIPLEVLSLALMTYKFTGKELFATSYTNCAEMVNRTDPITVWGHTSEGIRVSVNLDPVSNVGVVGVVRH